MQTNRSNRARPAQAPRVPVGNSRYTSDLNARPVVATLSALCLALPPAGILLLWRAERISLRLRAGLTALGFFCMTLYLFLFMKPDVSGTDLLPMPSVPQYAGYGSVSASQPIAVTQPAAVPVPDEPVVVAPVAPSAGGTPVAHTQELTEDTIVYAVNDTASSFHLVQVCDNQENNLMLLLVEALNAGLQPCEKCVGAAG